MARDPSQGPKIPSQGVQAQVQGACGGGCTAACKGGCARRLCIQLEQRLRAAYDLGTRQRCVCQHVPRSARIVKGTRSINRCIKSATSSSLHGAPAPRGLRAPSQELLTAGPAQVACPASLDLGPPAVTRCDVFDCTTRKPCLMSHLSPTRFLHLSTKFSALVLEDHCRNDTGSGLFTFLQHALQNVIYEAMQAA